LAFFLRFLHQNPMLSYSPMRATYPAYLVLRDLINQIIFTGTPNTVSRVPLMSSPYQANSCSGFQDIYFVLLTPVSYYHLYHFPGMLSIQNHTNSAHALLSYFLNTHILTLSCHRRLGLASGSFLQVFPSVPAYVLLLCPTRPSCSHSLLCH
jgi:hypothetical protein